MIIHDFNVVRVALAEFETNAPALVHPDRPLSSSIALVQAHAFQRTEIAKRFGNIQGEQQIHGGLEIQSAKLVRPLAIQTLRAAELRHDLIMAITYYGKR